MTATGLRTLTCSHCGAPATYLSTFCSYCRHSLVWDDRLALSSGSAFRSLDLARDALPGADQLSANSMLRRADGVLIDVSLGSFLHGELDSPLRDACVAVRATCLDAAGGVGVLARLHKIGHARSGYALSVRPGFHAFTVTRMLWTQTHSWVDVLRPWEVHPAILGVGAPNHIELRLGDSLLEVVINGAKVASLVDARFGFGTLGWRAISFPGSAPSKVLLHALEAKRIG